MNNCFKYYNSLEFCTIFSFFKSANDVRNLLILDNYMKLPDIDEDLQKKLSDTYENLVDEYNSQTKKGEDKILEYRKTIAYKKIEQDLILRIIHILSFKNTGLNKEIDFNALETILINYGVKFNYSNKAEFNKRLEQSENFAKSIDNEINILEFEINEYIEKQSNEKTSYIDMVMFIQSIADIKLDIYKDNMVMFLSAKKRAVEIIEAKEKQIQKIKENASKR